MTTPQQDHAWYETLATLGCVMPTSEASSYEIALARLKGKFIVDGLGYGYIEIDPEKDNSV